MNDKIKRAETGRKTGRGATRVLRFAIDEPYFHLAAIEITHLSNISPIGLPIYGGAGDIDFSRDIARTDFPGILTIRGDFLGGIEPARESNPLLRTCPGVAIPLGRLNPSHRMVAHPLLHDAFGPAHCLFAFQPDCLRRVVSIPVPSRRLLIYTINVYMASGNRISGRVPILSAQLPYRTPNGKIKRRPAELLAQRTAMPYPACRPTYRLERVGERLVFPQVDVDAGVLGGDIEQLLD